MKFNILKKEDSNIAFLFFSILISLIFLSSLLKYGPSDLESYNNGVIYSALIQAQHLLKGQFLQWYDGVGFGTPFPISAFLDFHPIYILSPLLPMQIVYSLFWLIHLSLGSFFIIKLCRLLNISKSLSLISGFLYVFSLPSINYSISDDWPVMFLTWTMFPIIVFFIYKFFLQKKRNFNYLIFILPIIFAFTIYNAPTVLNFWVILFFCILLIFLYRPNKYKFKQLLTIFILTCILVAPRYYHMLNEIQFFPEKLNPRIQNPIALKNMISNEFTLFNIDIPRLTVKDSSRSWWSLDIGSSKQRDPARTSFIGLVYFILAFTGISILWRLLRRKSNEILDVLKASAVLGFLLSLIFSLLHGSVFFNTIHPWQFRDQTIFFGIIAAGLQLKKLKSGILKKNKIIIPLLIIVQITHVFAYTNFLIFDFPSEKNNKNFFRSPERNGRFLNWLLYYSQTNDKRILLSPRIELEFYDPKEELRSEGFYAMSDLNLHAGLNPVNGNFKGVSMDRISPSSKFGEGLINSNYSLLNNPAFLNIAGINFLLVHESEFEELDFLPPSLWINGANVQVDSSQSVSGGASIFFDGTEHVFQLNANKDWAFGSEDFTIDFWIKFASTSGTQQIFGDKYSNPNKSWQFAWEEQRKSLLFSFSTDGENTTNIRFPWFPTKDTWYHIALVRKGTYLKAFVKGSQIGSEHHIGGVSIHDSKEPLLIGSRGDEEHFNGWLDEIRISKGIARWTSKFNPQNREYSKDSFTKLLLHCNGTEESNFRFKNTHVWCLLHNEDAWPKAFFISEKALNLNIEYRPDFSNKSVFNADLDGYLSYREEGNVFIKGDNGDYELTFSPKNEASVIGLSKFYRPEWKAVANGEKLEIKSLFNAFIAIKVPPGISRISLEFRQPFKILLLYVSLITFVLCFVFTCIFFFKQPQCSIYFQKFRERLIKW